MPNTFDLCSSYLVKSCHWPIMFTIMFAWNMMSKCFRQQIATCQWNSGSHQAFFPNKSRLLSSFLSAVPGNIYLLSQGLWIVCKATFNKHSAWFEANLQFKQTVDSKHFIQYHSILHQVTARRNRDWTQALSGAKHRDAYGLEQTRLERSQTCRYSENPMRHIETWVLQDDGNVGGVEQLDGIGPHLTTNLSRVSPFHHFTGRFYAGQLSALQLRHPLVLHCQVHSEAFHNPHSGISRFSGALPFRLPVAEKHWTRGLGNKWQRRRQGPWPSKSEIWLGSLDLLENLRSKRA